MKLYALSVKQPWAALLVHGLKTVEVRNWPTARRGRILIHAGRIPDDRPQAWTRVPSQLLEDAHYRGGIVGAVDLIDCRTYPDAEAFARDGSLHLNESDWFVPPKLFGFLFAAPEVLPFRPCPGWMRFFPLRDEDLRPAPPVTEPNAEGGHEP